MKKHILSLKFFVLLLVRKVYLVDFKQLYFKTPAVEGSVHSNG